MAPVWPQSGMWCGGYACTWQATAPRSFQHWWPCYESCGLRWTRVDPSRRALQQCHQEISSFAAAQKHLAELSTQQRGIPHLPSNIIMIMCGSMQWLSFISLCELQLAPMVSLSSFWAKQEQKSSKMFRPHWGLCFVKNYVAHSIMLQHFATAYLGMFHWSQFMDVAAISIV